MRGLPCRGRLCLHAVQYPSRPTRSIPRFDVKEVFETLIAAPLKRVTPPARAQLMMIDALDEIPKEGQKPLLELIAKQLALLPKWLRLFVTSRDEVRAPPDGHSHPLSHL